MNIRRRNPPRFAIVTKEGRFLFDALKIGAMVCYVGAQLDLGTAHDLHELDAEAAECSVSAESERQRPFKGKNR